MVSNFRTEISAFVEENLSPEARSKALATFARSERDELIKAGKASRTYTTYVDGREDPVEEHVTGTGGGVINYKFSFIGDAVEFALVFLRGRVPHVTGNLSESFWVSIAGKFIPPGVTINYAHIPPDAEIVIGNAEAYWRKADVNRRGNKVLKYSRPDILNDCVSAIVREFGRSAVTATRRYDYNFPGKYKPILSPNRARYVFNSPVVIIKAVQ